MVTMNHIWLKGDFGRASRHWYPSLPQLRRHPAMLHRESRHRMPSALHFQAQVFHCQLRASRLAQGIVGVKNAHNHILVLSKRTRAS